MPDAETISLVSFVFSVFALGLSLWLTRTIHKENIRLTERIHKEQVEHKKKELRRDVLRRLVGYRYRLTTKDTTDGEPFPAMNEALIVFNDCPESKKLLRKMRAELGVPNRLTENLLAVIKELAKESDVIIEFEDRELLESPFTPRKFP